MLSYIIKWFIAVLAIMAIVIIINYGINSYFDKVIAVQQKVIE